MDVILYGDTAIYANAFFRDFRMLGDISCTILHNGEVNLIDDISEQIR